MEPTVEKLTKKEIALWVMAAITITVMVAVATLTLLMLNKNTIYPETYIDGINVSNLTRDEAIITIKNEYENQLENLKFNLVYEDYRRQLNYRDLGYTYSYEKAVEKAYNLGRQGSIIRRIGEIYWSRKQAVIISLESDYEEKLLNAIIDDVASGISRQAQDATILRQDGKFHITKEKDGLEVDKELLKDRIAKGFESFSQENIAIPLVSTAPQITEERLQTIKEVIGEFSTVFNLQAVGRSKNISIAAGKINSTVLMPQEEFSFNQRTGPTGMAQGYQEAPVILKGELVPGIGGGVCQVSTTLYNAAVRANLDITTRRNHSLTVAYVPLGHDAAVAYDQLDLRFKNNFKTPIYIESFVSGNRIHARIYGQKKDKVKINLISEVLEVIEPQTEIIKDPNLLYGETKVERDAKKGYRVSTYKVYYENGREIKREHISKDYYAPVHGKIIEGEQNGPNIGEIPTDIEYLPEEQPISQPYEELLEDLGE